ncbi:MAG TPA: MarR family transcriptional regulator [Lacipirellulaceae bacterium]|nr:MarR family transcriptional regulator [Lacipirellulaceae bacterium]
MSVGISANGVANSSLRESQAATVHASLRNVVRNLLSVDDSMMDLPLRQLKVCTTLYRQCHTMSEISRELGLSPSAVTQVSNRLERRGLIERVSQNNDRRVRMLRLTRKGQRLMRSREEQQLCRIAAVLSKLSPKELQQIMTGLELLSQCSRAPRSDAC